MERVLVVNTGELVSLTNNESGFLGPNPKISDLIKTKSFFVDRADAETDETKKQIIPYCMVIHENKILAVKRKNPGEVRLKDLLSIGIGGHINPGDRGADVLFNAVMRELKEETDFDGNIAPQAIGFLSLDDTPVSRVHFGVVYKAYVDRDVKVIDEGLAGEFVTLNSLPELAEKMEGWSKVLAKATLPGEPKPL